MAKHFSKWTIEQLDDAIFDHDCKPQKNKPCPCLEWQEELEKRFKQQATRHKLNLELEYLEFINQERQDDVLCAN